jgi:alpha-L-fucosidase
MATLNIGIESDKVSESIVYNYIEFFFSKDELKTMMKIKPLSYEPWLDTLYDLYSSKAEDDSFDYNIKHTKEYERILKEYETIEDIIKGIKPQYLNKTDEQKKNDIKECIKKIESEYPKLYYYDETYMYAHYIFNNIRNSGVLQMGGGITLEEFKQRIREKIKLIGS